MNVDILSTRPRLSVPVNVATGALPSF